MGALKGVMSCRTLGMEAKGGLGLYEECLSQLCFTELRLGSESRREKKVECFRDEMFEKHGWSDAGRPDQ